MSTTMDHEMILVPLGRIDDRTSRNSDGGYYMFKYDYWRGIDFKSENGVSESTCRCVDGKKAIYLHISSVASFKGSLFKSHLLLSILRKEDYASKSLIISL